jgi:ABC-type glucose/galactose transport system permease subunit
LVSKSENARSMDAGLPGNDGGDKPDGLPVPVTDSQRENLGVYAGRISRGSGRRFVCGGESPGESERGVAYELDAIAAAVIDGTKLAGGSGSIGGTIVGTLTIGILTNMLRLNNVDSNVEMMLKAVIIVLAVTLQRR